jgi:hypothetical protein
MAVWLKAPVYNPDETDLHGHQFVLVLRKVVNGRDLAAIGS